MKKCEPPAHVVERRTVSSVMGVMRPMKERSRGNKGVSQT